MESIDNFGLDTIEELLARQYYTQAILLVLNHLSSNEIISLLL